MTDEQIVKALEYCENKNIPCKDCPFNELDCVNDLERFALDLINRQKAKIKEKDEMLKAQASKIFLYEDVLKQKTEEIEQWKEEANKYQRLWCEAMQDMQIASDSAIKKFAGLIKRRLNCNTPRGAYLINIVDNLVAEMTGKGGGADA